MSTEAAPASPGGVGRMAADTVGFLRATRAEMGKVTWPTKDELVQATRMIVVLSLVLGFAIGWMDLLFNLVLVDGVAALTR